MKRIVIGICMMLVGSGTIIGKGIFGISSTQYNGLLTAIKEGNKENYFRHPILFPRGIDALGKQMYLDSALYDAASKYGAGDSYYEDIALLLQAGANPHEKSSTGETAVVKALFGDKPKPRTATLLVQALLKKVPAKDLMLKTKSGDPLLIALVKLGYGDAVTELLQAGANPLVVDVQGKTALQWAQTVSDDNQKKSLIDALQKAGAQ